MNNPTPTPAPTQRQQLKEKIKGILRKRAQVKEMTTSGDAGSGAGSAGVPKTPNCFGQVKNPVTGLDGYTKVGSSSTGGVIDEKSSKNKDEKKPDTEKKPESGHDEPMVAAAKKPAAKDDLTTVTKALAVAHARLDQFVKSQNPGTVTATAPKKPDAK